MKHGCLAAMTFLVYCQRFWLTARLPKAVEKSDKKRLIQRSQILWQKGRDSEAPTLHQKEKRERETSDLSKTLPGFRDRAKGFQGPHPLPFSNLFRVKIVKLNVSHNMLTWSSPPFPPHPVVKIGLHVLSLNSPLHYLL